MNEWFSDSNNCSQYAQECFTIVKLWCWSWKYDEIDFASSLNFLFFFSIRSFFFIFFIYHYTISFSLFRRWVVIRSSEFQERIFDTIQRVFEFSSRRKFHTRSIVIVRSSFRWRRDKWFLISIHEINFFWSLITLEFDSFLFLQFISRSLSKHLFDSHFFRHFHFFFSFVWSVSYIVLIFWDDDFIILFFSTRTSSWYDSTLSFLSAFVVVLSTIQSLFLLVLFFASVFIMITTIQKSDVCFLLYFTC